MRVAVQSAGLTVGSPSGMCDAGMRIEDLCHVHIGFLDEFSEFDNLAHLFECKDLIPLVAVDCETSGVVTSVFETG